MFTLFYLHKNIKKLYSFYIKIKLYNVKRHEYIPKISKTCVSYFEAVITLLPVFSCYGH